MHVTVRERRREVEKLLDGGKREGKRERERKESGDE